MRKLMFLMIAAFLAWGGYWFVGSRAVETGLTTWIKDRRGDGWVAEYSELYTRGFPNRFDTIIRDMELADPRTGLAWNVPEFQILALSYKPHHIIAVWPPEQTFSTPNQRIDIGATNMRGSVVFVPGTTLELDRSSIVLDDISMTSQLGWSSLIETGRLATRQAEGDNTHDISFEASGVRPSKGLLTMVDPTGLLPKTFETLQIDATVGFDAPWDRFAIEKARPQPVAIDLRMLQAKWGDLDLKVAGKVTVDSVGIPTGEITVKAQNWREMLGIAQSAGLLPQGMASTAERFLEMLAGLSGSAKTLDAPLSFRNGFVSFGPIPLGPAPRLVIR